MRRFLLVAGNLALVMLLAWSASKVPAASPAAQASPRRSSTPAQTPTPLCLACPQATLVGVLTQEQINTYAAWSQQPMEPSLRIKRSQIGPWGLNVERKIYLAPMTAMGYRSIL